MTALLLLLTLQGLNADIDAIIASPKLHGASVGIVVQDVDGPVLYEHNPELRLLPASNEKLFTCAFALSRLGSGYRPRTLFWKEKNTLIVRSSGDPTTSYQSLKEIGRRLNPHRKPVEVSEAYRAGYPEGWQLGDLPNRYAAPVYALTVDRGSLELWNVEGRPQLRPARFDLAIAWNKRPGQFSDSLDVFHHRLTLTGALPKETKRLDTLGLPDSDFEAASLLGKSVRFVDHVPTRKPDFIALGNPITETMQTCLQMSDNNLAENFLLMAASRNHDLVDPYHEAIPQLKDFLKQSVGITEQESDPADGCGMSRHNVVTARAIVKLLSWSLNQSTALTWRLMLDHPGSGTMKSRLPGLSFQCKTGTLEHVSALSGYLNVSGHTFIISILLNNFAGPTSDAKKLEDLLVSKINANLLGGTRRAIK
jgi:D-alanyl-D-alanine carboxypeptidase/D-alanyl-D-alanine-endopeptidase (penicillin-binding protein 4)